MKRSNRWGSSSYFAQLISTRRTDLQLPVSRVAKSVGVAVSTIYAWEAGRLRRLPRPGDFNRLCRVLELDSVEVIEAMGYELYVARTVRRSRAA